MYTSSWVVEPKKMKATTTKDEENYINTWRKIIRLKLGWLFSNNFGRAAAVMDFTSDDDDQELCQQRALMKWNQKKKICVCQEYTKTRKIRTKSGVWIPTAFKRDRYQRWRVKVKVHQNIESSDNEGREGDPRFGGYRIPGATRGMNLQGRLGSLPKNHPAMVKASAEVCQGGQFVRNELKKPEEIEKARKLRDKARLRCGLKEAQMTLLKNKRSVKTRGRELGAPTTSHRQPFLLHFINSSRKVQFCVPLSCLTINKETQKSCTSARNMSGIIHQNRHRFVSCINGMEQAEDVAAKPPLVQLWNAVFDIAEMAHSSALRWIIHPSVNVHGIYRPLLNSIAWSPSEFIMTGTSGLAIIASSQFCLIVTLKLPFGDDDHYSSSLFGRNHSNINYGSELVTVMKVSFIQFTLETLKKNVSFAPKICFCCIEAVPKTTKDVPRFRQRPRLRAAYQQRLPYPCLHLHQRLDPFRQ